MTRTLRFHRSTIALLAAAFALRSPAFGECLIEKVEKQGERPELLLVENEFLRLTFDLESGGARCRQITIKPERDLNRPFTEPWPFNHRAKARRMSQLPAAGYFVERSGDFRARNVGKPGEIWPQFFDYKLTIVEDRPERSVLEFATVPDVHLRPGVENAEAVGVYRQMTYIKRITLTAGSPLVRVDHLYRNFGTEVEITFGAMCWVNPTTPKRHFISDIDGVHYCVDPHIGASGSLNTTQPSAGWVGYLENDNVGAAILADQPGRLDCTEIWNAGKNRGHDALMLFYNQFVTSQGNDLEHTYTFAPLVGLPRLDGLDHDFACGIEFDNARYQQHLKLLEGIQEPHATKTMGSARYMPRPWEDGQAAAAGEPVQVRAVLLPWKPGEVEMKATIRCLPEAEAKPLVAQTIQAETFKAQTLTAEITPKDEGTYVVAVEVLRNGKAASRFERPFVVGKPSKPYRVSVEAQREGLPLFSKLILKTEMAIESVTGKEAQRCVKGRGPYFFQFGPSKIKPWPGMTMVGAGAEGDLYTNEKGYGWTDLKGLRECKPGREGTKPDYIGAHGVWGALSGSSKSMTAPKPAGTFLIDLEPGDYEVAVLTNDVAGRYTGHIGRGPGLAHHVFANGEQVYERRLTNRQLIMDIYYHQQPLILRRGQDAYQEYMGVHLNTIRFPVKVEKGPMRLLFAGGLLVNALIVYPAAEKQQLEATLAELAKERRAATTWVEARGRKPSPGVEPTDADLKRGYRLCALPALSTFPECPYQSGPREADLERAFSYTACANQYLPFSIAVQPLKDLGNSRVTKAELVAADGSRIGEDLIRVGVVKYIPTPNRGLGHTPDGRLLKMPPDTPGFDRVPIDKGINRYFWAVVRVLPDAKPGTYTGKWTFQPEHAEPMTIPVEVKVYPVKLGRPAKTWWNCYYATYPGITLDRLLDDAHEHGMLYLRGYHLPSKPPADKKLTREEYNAWRSDYWNYEWRYIHWDDDTFGGRQARTSIVDVYKRAQEKGYEIRFILHRWGNHLTNPKLLEAIAKKEPGWEELLKADEERMVRQYEYAKQWFAERGLPEPLASEFVGEGIESPEAGEWLAAAVRAANRVGLDNWNFSWILAYKRALCARTQLVRDTPLSPWFSEEGRRKRKEQGIKTMLQYFPGSRYMWGFYLFEHNLQGGTHEGWGVSGGTGYNLIHNPFDGVWWHWGWAWGSSAGPCPILGGRWECMREGTTDYAYICLLRDTCDKVRASGEPNAAQAAEAGMKLIQNIIARNADPERTVTEDDLCAFRRDAAEKVLSLRKQFGVD